ncbi:HEAT repeat domain-containing protein [Verrucomicrobiota bacterium]
MRCLGTVTGYISEAFYVLVPFTRPDSSEYPFEEDVEPPVQIEPMIEPMEDLAYAVEPEEQTEHAPGTAEERNYRPDDIRDILSFIDFESKLQLMEAEVYVKDFHSKPKAVRRRALGRIAELPEPIAVEILRRILLIKQDSLRVVQILNTLAGLNDDGRLEKTLFVDFLDDPNPAVRLASLWAFAKYRDEDSLSLLTASLDDADPQIRRQALNLLSWSHQDRSSVFALKMLRDPDEHVRKTAIASCALCKLRHAVSPLITLLGDPDEEVRQCALDSLREITGQNFAFEVAASAEDRDKAIAAWRSWWRSNQATSDI